MQASKSKSGQVQWRRRCGLAPLELVLNLFFLLLLMALIINFGTIASWTVRGNEAARWSTWRSIGLKTGSAYPNPINWRATGATMGLMPGQPVNPTRMNPIWNQGDLTQAAVRGQPIAPAIIDPATGNLIGMGNQQYMEMVNNAQIGVANLSKQMPLLPKLKKAEITPMLPILNPFWRFEDMAAKSVDGNGYPWSMRNNGDWRLFKWYLLEAYQLPNGDVQQFFSDYQAADQAIQQFQSPGPLAPLDRDDEFMAAGRVPPPDFYPRVGGCEANPVIVQQTIIASRGGLIMQIEGPRGGGKGGVPDNMANAFIQFYQQQVDMLSRMTPPDQQQISSLQQKIQQLKQFQATLF